jgi:hypothetical protein
MGSETKKADFFMSRFIAFAKSGRMASASGADLHRGHHSNVKIVLVLDIRCGLCALCVKLLFARFNASTPPVIAARRTKGK